MRSLSFTVLGRPQQRGSKSPFVYRGKDGKHRASMCDDNKKSKAWMQEVRSAAYAAFVDRFGEDRLFDGPLVLNALFFFQRPKSHFGSGKNSSELKESAPAYHFQSPDLAKLIRALEDAMTGVVWVDDRLVFRYDCSRHWADNGPERVEVVVKELGV